MGDDHCERLPLPRAVRRKWERVGVRGFSKLWRLASLEGAGVAWKDVLARIEAMQAAGTLIPADQPFLEQARRLAAAAKAAEAE